MRDRKAGTSRRGERMKPIVLGISRRKPFDARPCCSQAFGTNTRTTAFFIVDDQHGSVLEVHHRRIRASNCVDQDVVAPGLALVQAVVQARRWNAVCQQDDVVSRPQEIRAVTRKAHRFRDTPCPAAIFRDGEIHGGTLSGIQCAVLPLDDVGFRVEPSSSVVDVDHVAPSLASVVADNDRAVSRGVGFAIQT